VWREDFRLFAILITIHVLVAVGLIISVLMQSAKGEGLAGAFGGGGGVSGAVFGGRGAAPFLSKATTVLAIAFMLMCILLTLVTGGGRRSATSAASAVQDYAREQAQPMSPQDVQEVNVGQGAVPNQGAGTGQDLPVEVIPNPGQGTQPAQPQGNEGTQPSQQQGTQTEQPDEGGGGSGG
jgi:preprotein translocase subunit SecG